MAAAKGPGEKALVAPPPAPPTRTLVMAGRSSDTPGVFVGFDGERRRFAGEIFYDYNFPVGSWCRIKGDDGEWVDAPQRQTKSLRTPLKAPVRRAHPKTLPGQAPTRRVHQLELDEAELAGVPFDTGRVEVEEEAPAGRASDRLIE